MKKILALALVILLSFSLVSCKKESEVQKTSETKAQAVADEEIPPEEITIRTLLEQNLDCYFLFYVSPLEHTDQQNSDAYYGTTQSVFKSYEELEELVNSTYTKKKAKELLNYPSKEMPLYKNVEGLIFVYPAVIEPVEYDIIWDTYSVEPTKVSDKEYTFTAKTVDLDGKEYVTEGKVVKENDEWRLADLVY